MLTLIFLLLQVAVAEVCTQTVLSVLQPTESPSSTGRAESRSPQRAASVGYRPEPITQNTKRELFTSLSVQNSEIETDKKVEPRLNQTLLGYTTDDGTSVEPASSSPGRSRSTTASTCVSEKKRTESASPSRIPRPVRGQRSVSRSPTRPTARPRSQSPSKIPHPLGTSKTGPKKRKLPTISKDKLAQAAVANPKQAATLGSAGVSGASPAASPGSGVRPGTSKRKLPQPMPRQSGGDPSRSSPSRKSGGHQYGPDTGSSSPRSSRSDSAPGRRRLPKVGGKGTKAALLEAARESDVESGFGETESLSVNLSLENTPRPPTAPATVVVETGSSCGSQDDVVLAVLEADRAVRQRMENTNDDQPAVVNAHPTVDMPSTSSMVGSADLAQSAPVRVVLDQDEPDQASVSHEFLPSVASELSTSRSQGNLPPNESVEEDSGVGYHMLSNQRPVSVPANLNFFYAGPLETSSQPTDSLDQSTEIVYRRIEVLDHQIQHTRHLLQPDTNLESDTLEETSFTFDKDTTRQETTRDEDLESWRSGLTEPDPLPPSVSTRDLSTQTPCHRTTQTPEDACTQTPRSTDWRHLALGSLAMTTPRDTDQTDQSTARSMLMTMSFLNSKPPSSRTETMPTLQSLPTGSPPSTQVRQYEEYLRGFDGEASGAFVPGELSGGLRETPFNPVERQEASTMTGTMLMTDPRETWPESAVMTSDQTGATAMPMLMPRNPARGAAHVGLTQPALGRETLSGTSSFPQELPQEEHMVENPPLQASPLSSAPHTQQADLSTSRDFSTQTFGQVENVSRHVAATQTSPMVEAVETQMTMQATSQMATAQLPDSFLLLGQPIEASSRSAKKKSKKKDPSSEKSRKGKKSKGRDPDQESSASRPSNGMSKTDILKYMLKQVRDLKSQYADDEPARPADYMTDYDRDYERDRRRSPTRDRRPRRAPRETRRSLEGWDEDDSVRYEDAHRLTYSPQPMYSGRRLLPQPPGPVRMLPQQGHARPPPPQYAMPYTGPHGALPAGPPPVRLAVVLPAGPPPAPPPQPVLTAVPIVTAQPQPTPAHEKLAAEDDSELEVSLSVARKQAHKLKAITGKLKKKSMNIGNV